MSRRFLAVGLGALAALSLSCGSGGIADSDQPDTDYVMFAGVPSGGSLNFATDVRCGVPLVIDFDVTVEFAAISPPTGQTRFDTFKIEKYIVTYKNLLTGGSAPAFDVPNAYEVTVPAIAERVPYTLSLEGFPILAAGAKNELPLSNSSNIPPGGLDLLATIEVWGRPEFSDRDDWTRASFNYRFTVFDSGVTNAPGCL